MKKQNLFFVLIATILFFTSCTTQITLKVNGDGSISTQVYGMLGKEFENLIRTSQNLSEAEPIFDIQMIKNQLDDSGYSNILVNSRNGNDITIKTTDSIRDSIFFNSGIIALKNNRMIINLNRKNLQKFYEMLDEDFSIYLDLLLSPVFADEQMSQDEYVQTVSSFYGKSIANELKKADVNLIILNADGTSAKHKISLVELLTLNKSLQLE